MAKWKWDTPWLKFKTVPATFLNLRLAVFLVVIVLALGVLGFMIIEQYALIDAIYMAIITISTVGYTEVKPLTDTGKIFASIYIVLNIGIFTYVLAVFSYYIIQGEIFKKMHLNLIKNQLEKLQNHVILCGFGRYGHEVSLHFKKHRIPFVIIDQDPEKIKYLQESGEGLIYIEGDATHDEILIQAEIKKAKAIISALPDDSDNLFIVLSARQLNPKIDIISRAKNHRSEKKLMLAGANHVILPDNIGGFYMAMLVTKPGAVDFFSFITNE